MMTRDDPVPARGRGMPRSIVAAFGSGARPILGRELVDIYDGQPGDWPKNVLDIAGC